MQNIDDSILSILVKCNLLEKLNLYNLEKLTKLGQAKYLGDTPLSLANLLSLSISKCNRLKEILVNVPALHKMSVDGCPKLATLGVNCPLLRSLDLRGNVSLENADIEKVVEKCPSLKRLYLTGCTKITYLELRQADPRYSIKTLESLPNSIRNCIVSSFAQYGVLNTLDLGLNTLNDGTEKKVNDADFEKLCSVLKAGTLKPSISNLFLGTNPITNKGILALAGMLKTTSVIKNLHLGNTHCTQEGLVSLLEALADNKSLTWLDLGQVRKPANS